MTPTIIAHMLLRTAQHHSELVLRDLGSQPKCGTEEPLKDREIGMIRYVPGSRLRLTYFFVPSKAKLEG